MELRDTDWRAFAAHTDGPGFARFQRELTRYNRCRLEPSLPDPTWRDLVRDEACVAEAEGDFVEAMRKEIAPLAADIPVDVESFIAWFERLRDIGPGQGDPLFPWLAAQASLEQMKWFIEQEVAGEAGFDDLLAITQVKMPEQAKLEMARNYWDEMGRGASKGMHGPMLDRLAHHVAVQPTPETVIPEALALGNLMVALAHNRRYAFHSIGALGVIEMTAPTRAGHVDRALRRLNSSQETALLCPACGAGCQAFRNLESRRLAPPCGGGSASGTRDWRGRGSPAVARRAVFRALSAEIQPVDAAQQGRIAPR